MDEPFAALDYITRMVMRQELLRIWERERKTVLLVTHDIDEAVQLGDRVLVMSARPAHIREDLEIPMPHPRDVEFARVHRAARAHPGRDGHRPHI